MISLRRRLVLAHVLALAAILGLGAAFADHELRRELVAQFDAASATKASALATLVEETSEGPELRFADENMPEFGVGPAAEYFEVRRADGSVLERSRSLRGAAMDPPPGAPSGAVWALDLPDGRPGRAVLVRFVPEVEDEGEAAEARPAPGAATMSLVLARSSAGLQAGVRSLRLRLLVAGLVLLVGGALVTSLVVGRGLAPVARLGERAASIGPATLDVRFPAGEQPRELEPIRERLNDLLDRLQRAFERERSFTADAAHELRTPIAEVRAAAELALRHPDDATAVQHALETSRAASLRMASLVSSLLLLARAESGTIPLDRREVDLAAVARGAWAPFEVAARRRHLDVAFALGEPVVVATDETLVGIVLGNLFANATEHGTHGGTLRVAAAHDGGGAKIVVENGVEGLAPEDVPNLFARFWRKDDARADGRHAGIGLAVAREVVARLGGALDAELVGARTLRVTLRLPDGAPVSAAAAAATTPR